MADMDDNLSNAADNARDKARDMKDKAKEKKDDIQQDLGNAKNQGESDWQDLNDDW